MRSGLLFSKFPSNICRLTCPIWWDPKLPRWLYSPHSKLFWTGFHAPTTSCTACLPLHFHVHPAFNPFFFHIASPRMAPAPRPSVYIVSAVRTPIGQFQGHVPPKSLLDVYSTIIQVTGKPDCRTAWCSCNQMYASVSPPSIDIC